MNPAFAYVYDEALANPRHQRLVSDIENEAVQAGIEGRVLRVGMFRDAKESLKELEKHGVKNLIFVGTDQMLLSHIHLLPNLDMTIGFLPIIPDSYLARAFRLPVGAKAVQTIAGRLIESLDLGKVGERLFLTEIVVTNTDAGIEVNEAYRVSPRERGGISIRNLCTNPGETGSVADPQDGMLEILIQSRVPAPGLLSWRKQEMSETRLYLKEGALVSKLPIDAFVDGQKMTNTRFAFSIVPKALKIITGKEGVLPKRG